MSRQEPISRMPNKLEDVGEEFLRKFRFTEKVLGEGAFATVCVVQHLSDQEEFACKILEKSSYDERGMSEMLKLEVKTSTEIEHENVIKILWHFETDSFHLLVMDIIRSNLLTMTQEEHRNGNLGFHSSVVKPWMVQVVDGLTYLHQAGIAHRDIKLDNLLYEPSLHRGPYIGAVKVADFGWCARMDEYGNCPGMGGQCGTSVNNAPEVEGEPPYSGAKGDAWQVGLCIFHLLVFNYFSNAVDTNCENWRVEKLLPFIKKSLQSLDYKQESGDVAWEREGGGEQMNSSAAATPNLTTLVLSLMDPEPAERMGLTDLYVALCLNFDEPRSEAEVPEMRSASRNYHYYDNSGTWTNPDSTANRQPTKPIAQSVVRVAGRPLAPLEIKTPRHCVNLGARRRIGQASACSFSMRRSASPQMRLSGRINSPSHAGMNSDAASLNVAPDEFPFEGLIGTEPVDPIVEERSAGVGEAEPTTKSIWCKCPCVEQY